MCYYYRTVHHIHLWNCQWPINFKEVRYWVQLDLFVWCFFQFNTQTSVSEAEYTVRSSAWRLTWEMFLDCCAITKGCKGLPFSCDQSSNYVFLQEKENGHILFFYLLSSGCNLRSENHASRHAGGSIPQISAVYFMICCFLLLLIPHIL